MSHNQAQTSFNVFNQPNQIVQYRICCCSKNRFNWPADSLVVCSCTILWNAFCTLKYFRFVDAFMRSQTRERLTNPWFQKSRQHRPFNRNDEILLAHFHWCGFGIDYVAVFRTFMEQKDGIHFNLNWMDNIMRQSRHSNTPNVRFWFMLVNIIRCLFYCFSAACLDEWTNYTKYKWSIESPNTTVHSVCRMLNLCAHTHTKQHEKFK